MEPQSQGLSGHENVSGVHDHHMDINLMANYADLPASCNLCGRIVQSAELEIFSLCGDCKFLLLEDLGNPVHYSTRRHSARRRTRRRRIRHSSSQSIRDLPSEQFTRLINMARQSLSVGTGYEDQRADDDGAARMLQQTSSHTTPSGSRRWRRGFSDTESEDFDNFDSRYGETESNISFTQSRLSHGDTDAMSLSAYGESDASTDRHGFLDTEIFVQQDDRSDFDFDTDIDPMHAGLNQWNSDEDGGEWEEADAEEGRATSGVGGTQYRNYVASPTESYSSITHGQQFDSPEFGGEDHQRTVESRQVLSSNIFNGFEDMDFSSYVANVGDYLDERDFEELLEQLAESGNSRRGAPPASASFVRNLPRVIIDEEQVKKDNDGLVCAICKELFSIGSKTIQLPCLHLYHTRCILPWLNARNSCPLCRYELPTDDRDYEEGKHDVIAHRIVDQDAREDSSSDYVTEAEGGTIAESDPVHGERDERDTGVSRVGRGRWLFLAAAPVASLVGIVLAMWLGNPQRRGIGSSHNQRGNRSRRWLSFF